MEVNRKMRTKLANFFGAKNLLFMGESMEVVWVASFLRLRSNRTELAQIQQKSPGLTGLNSSHRKNFYPIQARENLWAHHYR